MMPGGPSGYRDLAEARIESSQSEDWDIDAGRLRGVLAPVTDPSWSLLMAMVSFVAGLVLLMVGAIMNKDGGPMLDSDASFAESFSWVFGWIMLFVSFLLFGVYGSQKQAREEEELKLMESLPDEPYYPVTPVGAVTYHEVIKVRCRYCGTLNDVTAKQCIACGASL